MLEVKDGKMFDSNYLDIESSICVDLITVKIKNIWTITNSFIICYNIKNFINWINS